MVEYVIEIVNSASFCVAVWQRPHTFVAIIELVGKAPEYIRHGDIGFSISVVGSRIKDTWND